MTSGDAVRRAPARRLVQLLGLSLATASVAAAAGPGVAAGYVVHSRGGHAYGLYLKPSAQAGRRRLATVTAADAPIYHGGAVMVSSNLHLIFWGPRGAFSPSYARAVEQWTSGLAAESGKLTNAYSVASLYYANRPRRQISRSISYGGATFDRQRFPRARDCVNPSHPRQTCLIGTQFEAEIARVVKAQHWPTDTSAGPRNQYLVLTPRNVQGCDDNTGTSCTFSGANGWCAEHSSFSVGHRMIVYSLLPDEPACDSGQAPAGVSGDADADGTLDSAIHEVLESATDPLTRGTGWVSNGSFEVGDMCDSAYGAPLGGSLAAHTAYNQVINGHDYYTQTIWSTATAFAEAGCAQRTGPSPALVTPTAATAGVPVRFDGSGSYDISGPITQYIWNYGDGSGLDVTSGAAPTHVYAQPGTYQVSLEVVDASGTANASVATQTEVVR